MSGGKTPTFGIDVELGDHEYRVQPQRHAYLKRELKSFIGELGNVGETDVDQLLDVGTDQFYRLLGVMIPDLMPKWEWDGYASPQDAEADRYDRDTDRSPTPPQIKGALRAAIDVNEFDWVGQLKNFIGPDVIRAQIRAALAQRAAEAVEARRTKTASSEPSPSLPHQNGESAQTSSGMSVPTTHVPPQAPSD